jgi:CDP-diglyceride synthetase
MITKKRKSFLSDIPSWGLALVALIAPFVFTVLLLILGDIFRIDEDAGDPFFYLFFDLFIALCCYYIVRQNPKSIWYVPVLCNAVGIFSAIAEPNFWISSLWMFICGGWVLSIIASVIGYRTGKRKLPDQVI